MDLITIRVHFVKYLSWVNTQKLIKNTLVSNLNYLNDWRVTLIDRADNRKELRRRDRFWQYKLNTFFTE